MFLSETLCNPHNCDGIQSCGISEQLSEVRMVSALKLVLNQHPVTCGRVLTKDVRPKWSNFGFLGLQFEFNTDGFTQQLQVFFLCQPRSEIDAFGTPGFPQIH